MPPLIVGFIGLPGAGKSTLAKELLVELDHREFECSFVKNRGGRTDTQQKGLRHVNKLKKFYDFAASCLSYRHIALTVFLYVLRVTTPLNLINDIRSISTLLIRLRFVKTILGSNYDLIILDETFIQYVWLIAINREPPSTLYLRRIMKSILAVMPYAIILVDVDVDVDLAVERINQRATMHSLFDKIPPNEAKQLLTKHKRLINEITNQAVEMSEVYFLKVNGSHPLKQNSKTVAQFIEQVSSTLGSKDNLRQASETSALLISMHGLSGNECIPKHTQHDFIISLDPHTGDL